MNKAYAQRINYEAVFWITVLHLGALAAIPFFTWKAFTLCMVLLFVVSPIGVNLTYHRLLAHRAVKAPQWFEYILVTIGTLSAQGPVIGWVAGHRFHHRYSDQMNDLHTPNRGGFWGAHLIANVTHSPFFDKEEEWKKYVPDLTSNRYYVFLSKHSLGLSFISLPFLYLAGGIPFVMWGGFVRVFLMLHITWLVNSASHMWGYRNFDTPDRSTNCWWVGLLAAGEGWHNNHHAQPRSAAHGMRWYEFDLTYLLIRMFESVGLLYDVKRPNLELLDRKRFKTAGSSDGLTTDLSDTGALPQVEPHKEALTAEPAR